jgi:predicted NAD/FAD-dependent oxidoreductase
METETLAIIGAGMAGLTLGRLALEAGITPAVFDKGRKPGGRLATRRLESCAFNHGCQHFTARDPGFAALTAAHGVQPWAAAGDGRLVGTPDMASLAEALAAPVNPLVSTHIHAIKYEDGGWTLTAPARPPARFATLVLAIPPVQAAALLPPDHRFQAALVHAHLAPSWTVMLDMGDAVGPDTLRLDDGGPLAWIAREASRPGAAPSGAYTIQASARWSTDHLEDSAESVIAALTAAFAAATGITAAPRSAHAHRWRYALADAPLGEPFLWDAEQKLGLCGDWCLAPRLEAAYLSATALGKTMLNDI